MLMKTGLSASAEPSSLPENFDIQDIVPKRLRRAKLGAFEVPERIYIVTFPRAVRAPRIGVRLLCNLPRSPDELAFRR